MFNKAILVLTQQSEKAGNQVIFLIDFFKNLFKKKFEWNEFIKSCYIVGYKSFSLVAVTGFVLGLVLTLQSQPTLKSYGAASYIPSMVAISLIREIGPVITALICAGKIASSIGAELSSMKVNEQIDAMEVSGSNPIQYLVVPRILACVCMIPLLTLMADAVGILGGYISINIADKVSWILYFNKAFSTVTFSDLIPACIKTIFFGFAIGFVGCYKGYTANRGTASVGLSANAAVVYASLWVIILDAIAVQLTTILAYN